MSSLPQQSEAAQVRDLEVREYMEQMTAQNHSVFSLRPLCDDKTGRWLNPPDNMLLSAQAQFPDAYANARLRNLNEIYSECLNSQLLLTTRVNEYLEKSKMPPVSPEANGDWDAVKTQMEKACAVLDDVLSKKRKRPGLTGAIRRGFNMLCRNAGTGKALVSIIPSDLMIASAVSGGLKVIFVALEQHGIYEESVFKALGDLPDILNANEKYSDIAAEDKEIHRLTAKLYARVCEVLDYILRWMIDNVLVSAAKQMFKGNRYAKDLNDKMGEVRTEAQALEKRANILLLQSHKNMSNLQSDMYLQQLKVGQQVESLKEEFDKLTSKVDRVNKLEVVVPMIFNSFQSVLREDWNQFHRNHGIRKSQQKQLTSPRITADDVLTRLLFEPDLVPEDIEYLLRQGTANLHQKIQPYRLMAIQDNPRIKAWLSLDSPSLLLINGNSTSHLDLSTSFFSAKIMNTLMEHFSQPLENIEIIPLAYFCGQHQHYYTEVAASPTELAMSLLLQLINSHRDFEPDVLQKCLKKTNYDDLGSILNSLERLLDSLPLEAMVFVIIDGVEHFTRPDKRRDGLREIFIQLVHLFREQRGAKVKLLFTSTQKAVMLEELGLIMDDEIVNIPKSPPPRGQPNDRNILIEL